MSEQSDFQKFVEAEAKKKMIEAQKKHEAAWQRIAGAVQQLGQNKAALIAARSTGQEVMAAAANFRNSEAAMMEAINNMVDLIAKEHL